MIASYIKDLLFEQDCVVIPDFGGFIANYVNADIHPVRHTFSPPSKRIAFNEMLRLNDGLLASYVSQHEGVSREEALRKIKAFTNSLRDELKQKNRYRLEEIGTLFLNQEQKLQFEPEDRVNYLNDSFGLPELLYKPVERTAAPRNDRPVLGRRTAAQWIAAQRAAVPFSNKDQSTMLNEEIYDDEEHFEEEEETTSASRLWLYITVPVVLLLGATTGLFLFYDDGNTFLSSFNPFTSLYTQNTKAPERPSATNVAVDSLATPTDSTDQAQWNDSGEKEVPSLPESNAPVSKIAPAQPEVAPTASTESEKAETKTVVEAPAESPAPDYVAIATEVPRYYLIVGSFTERRNAMKLQQKLASEGMNGAKLIIPKVATNLHKVSYADFGTLEEANQQLEQIKPTYGGEVWVFKYVK